ncbi:DUF447 domain-containing protein [Natronorubrum thiooxidans]|uniref:DUF447 family protein n=1 Tax=Natronorubrum thiooxidans TaxID=308853 RepID=A0A1N7ENG6_9EURY|nr:DUF447 domain-containing protein [Natronorubrum thiooxidans]SIR89633.1 hypothetical protein SAMN05421752_104288 [Natronorubrum thiooxidans]
MSDDRDGDDDTAGAERADWPVSLSGVTESVVTTLGPNGLWNAAPLGLFADDGDGRITARTWGKTRTRGNFHRQGECYVQFVDDPVVFADAALSIVEHEEPILEAANAWARVTVESLESGTDDGTDWERWALRPVDAEIRAERVPTIDRGFGAVIEATVAASRLGVAGYDDDDLRDRLEYCASVVDRAGSPREHEALERVREHADW